MMETMNPSDYPELPTWMTELVDSNPTPADMLIEGRPRVMRGWYDLPMAASMWKSDARALNA